MIKVDKLETLKLKAGKDGDRAFCSEDKTTYLFNEKNGWEKEKTKMDLSILELNRQVISQLEPMTADEILEMRKYLTDWQYRKEKSGVKTYLLYGKEISYFTMFRKTESSNKDSFETCVVECLKSIGDIKTFDKGSDKIEFWVEDRNSSQVTFLYLFPFDSGVEEFYG